VHGEIGFAAFEAGASAASILVQYELTFKETAS
jgi:hypothetical protein